MKKYDRHGLEPPSGYGVLQVEHFNVQSMFKTQNAKGILEIQQGMLFFSVNFYFHVI